MGEYNILLSIGMGSQLMNSILYLVNYFHQTRDSNSVNYVTNDFPCGEYLQHRLFMYVNVLWTLLPLYVILCLVREYNERTNNDKYNMEKLLIDKNVETRM